MIVSFAYTVDALLAGRKKCTRRDWNADYARRFKEGSVHLAYDRLPRVHGKKVGNIKITQKPYLENTRDIPDTDFEAEGLKYMEENGLLICGITPRQWFDNWRGSDKDLWVVRLDLVFPCNRCGRWTAEKAFGPKNLWHLCEKCGEIWSNYQKCGSNAGVDLVVSYQKFVSYINSGGKDEQ
jgi:hypothetical protein